MENNGKKHAKNRKKLSLLVKIEKFVKNEQKRG